MSSKRFLSALNVAGDNGVNGVIFQFILKLYFISYSLRSG